VALALDPDDVEGAVEDPTDLHLTLAYLGDVADLPDPERLKRVVAGFAAIAPEVEGEVSGVGRFANGERPVYASFDAPTLPDWRHRLVQHLRMAGYPPDATHGFTPHITLAYPIGPVPLDVLPTPVTFGTVTLALGGDRYDWPLEGQAALFAEYLRGADGPPLPAGGKFDPPPAKPAPRQDAPGGQYEPDFPAADPDTHPWPGEPTGTGERGEVGVIDPEDQDIPPPVMDRLWVQAFKRWVQGISADVAHHRALASAKQIDPDFTITDRQARRAFHALGKGDQPVLFADPHRRLVMAQAGRIPPPGYVQSVYEQYRYSAAQQQALADYLLEVATQGYLEGINAQLVSLGEPIVTSVTDAAVLAQLREEAASTAAGIANTYDRDLGGVVYQEWVDLRAERGAQMSRYWLEQAVEEWGMGRAAWKAEQIAATEINRWWNRAGIDFTTRNTELGLLRVQRAYVTPDECQCAACLALVAGNPYSMAEAALLNLPLHPHCVHFVNYVWEDVAPSGQLWAGQDSEAA
jgi:2'-5' RNA ligase